MKYHMKWANYISFMIPDREQCVGLNKLKYLIGGVFENEFCSNSSFHRDVSKWDIKFFLSIRTHAHKHAQNVEYSSFPLV